MNLGGLAASPRRALLTLQVSSGLQVPSPLSSSSRKAHDGDGGEVRLLLTLSSRSWPDALESNKDVTPEFRW